jgi:hypothetical protein
MRRFFKEKTSFYVKRFVLCGGVVALLYCSNMFHGNNQLSEEQLDVIGNYHPTVEGARKSQAGYPHAKLANLISQVTALQMEFHKSYNDENFCSDTARMGNLLDRVKSVYTELLTEWKKFTSYKEKVSFKRQKRLRDDNGLFCSKGKRCRETVRSSARDRSSRNRAIERYLNTLYPQNKKRLEYMSKSLETARLRDEATMGRAKNKAMINEGTVDLIEPAKPVSE